MFLGTQSDNKPCRAVAQRDSETLASSNGAAFIEVSAKTGDNLELVSSSLTSSLLRREAGQRTAYNLATDDRDTKFQGDGEPMADGTKGLIIEGA